MTEAFVPGNLYRNRHMIDLDIYVSTVAHVVDPYIPDGAGYKMVIDYVYRRTGHFLGTSEEVFVRAGHLPNWVRFEREN
ncbi:MAG: hypothetical protein ACREGB_04695 [Candidatus Saccharimonadales bacterium]